MSDVYIPQFYLLVFHHTDTQIKVFYLDLTLSIHNKQTKFSLPPSTIPTTTLLTLSCTQVLWFLARLTRTRPSGVATRPTPRITIIPTRSTQCIRGV